MEHLGDYDLECFSSTMFSFEYFMLEFGIRSQYDMSNIIHILNSLSG